MIDQKEQQQQQQREQQQREQYQPDPVLSQTGYPAQGPHYVQHDSQHEEIPAQAPAQQRPQQQPTSRPAQETQYQPPQPQQEDHGVMTYLRKLFHFMQYEHPEDNHSFEEFLQLEQNDPHYTEGFLL